MDYFNFKLDIASTRCGFILPTGTFYLMIHYTREVFNVDFT